MPTSMLREAMQRIVADPARDVASWIRSHPEIVRSHLEVGATRADADAYFLQAIHRHILVGDTALHIAAAAHELSIVKLLVSLGADVGARNRRGAQPLHDAAEPFPSQKSNPAKVIAALVSSGADPNAADRSGATPLHRAVRKRSLPAVEALLQAGASATLKNASGSTPLHLAVQSTGASGAGSEIAKRSQLPIIRCLVAHGGRIGERNGSGKTVLESATNPTVRAWLLELA